MKQILTIFIVFITITSYAQYNFEEGYYIKPNGDRITGLIKLQDRNTNPTEITFKKSTMGPQEIIKSNNMLGFGIGNSLQYDKFSVKISKASDDLTYMDRVKEFDLVQETAMLKLLVDGEAQLYEYNNEGITQYFIREGNQVTTLLYKRYLLRGGIATNNQYKQQLSTMLICDSGKLPDPVNLKYTASSLKKFVRSYNECNGTLNKEYVSEESKIILAMKLLGGLQRSNFEADINGTTNADFGSNTSLVTGLEFELKFPSKTANGWSIFTDARLNTFEGTSEIQVPTLFSDEFIIRETVVNYNAIDIGLGGRYYLGLGKNSKLYFGINVSIDFITDLDFTFESEVENGLEGKGPTGVLGLGAGYNWRSLSAEIRYYTNRDIIGGALGAANGSTYSNLAFTLSYSFLNLKI